MWLAALAGCAGQPPTVDKTVRPAERAAGRPDQPPPGGATAVWGVGAGATGQSHATPAHVSQPRFVEVEAASVTGREPRELPMYDGHSGERINWSEVMRRAANADAIILGEQHDDAQAHAVQLAMVQDVSARWPRAGVLTMEMLERDEQVVVDDYLEGIVDAATFAKLTDSVTWAGEGSWTNWYQPIIDAAAFNGWGVVAANAPRRYVRIVRTDGYERLKKLPPEREALVAVPVTWPMDYRQRFIDVMNGTGGDDEEEDESASPATQPATAPTTAAATRPASPHGPMKPEDIDPGFRSQLLWDSTMADSIARALRTPRTRKVIHLVGQFHSDFAGGTVKELRARRPIARVLTVSMQRGDGESLRECDEGRADIIIYTGRRLPEPQAQPDTAPAS